MTATIWPIAGCALLLAATGWWIGRQFSKDIALTGSTRLLVVMTRARGHGCETGRRLSQAAREVASWCSVAVVPEGAASSDPSVLRLECTGRDGAGFGVSFNPPVIHADSFAIRRITFEDNLGKNDWRLLAAITLANGEVEVSGDLPDNGFETQYLRAWCTMRRAARRDTPREVLGEAYTELRDCIEDWPIERDGEKPVVLANLASVCLAMPKMCTNRIPRLLEGFDAAQNALRKTYDLPQADRIIGLRRLLIDLRWEIEQGTSATGSNHRHLTPDSASRSLNDPFVSPPIHTIAPALVTPTPESGHK